MLGSAQGVRCSEEEPGLSAGTAIKEPLLAGGDRAMGRVGGWVLQALHSPGSRNWVCLAPVLVPKGSGRFCCLQGKRK